VKFKAREEFADVHARYFFYLSYIDDVKHKLELYTTAKSVSTECRNAGHNIGALLETLSAQLLVVQADVSFSGRSAVFRLFLGASKI